MYFMTILEQRRIENNISLFEIEMELQKPEAIKIIKEGAEELGYTEADLNEASKVIYDKVTEKVTNQISQVVINRQTSQ
jgi:hypothetical protein